MFQPAPISNNSEEASLFDNPLESKGAKKADSPGTSQSSDHQPANLVEGNLQSGSPAGQRHGDVSPEKAMLDCCREEQPLNRFNPALVRRHSMSLRRTNSVQNMSLGGHPSAADMSAEFEKVQAENDAQK